MTKPSQNTLSHRDYEEKRNFIRMQVDTHATITDTHGLTSSGRCINLSGSGALLELNHNLAVNDAISVHIHSAHGHNPMLDVKGYVIRGQAAHTPGKYWVAMHYT